MSISNRWAIQRVFSVDLFDLSTGMNIGHLSALKNSTFTQEATVVYSQGGAGDAKIIGFDHSKMAKFTISNAIFDSAVIGTIQGATPVTGTNTDLVWTDTLTVTTNAATTTYTALGTAGAEIKYVYTLNTDGSLGTQMTQAATATTGKFTYTVGTKGLAFYAGDIVSGSQIVVFYKATAGSDSVTISSYTDLFAKNVKLVANSVVRDTCTSVDYKAQIILPKCKISNSLELAVTSDGDPAVMAFEAEALQSCGSTKLWDMIIYTTAS